MFGRETRMLLRHYLEQGTTTARWRVSWASAATRSHRWLREGELHADVDDLSVQYGRGGRFRPNWIRIAP